MSIDKILSVFGLGNVRLTPEERTAFQREQTCSIGFAGLPRIVRYFI